MTRKLTKKGKATIGALVLAGGVLVTNLFATVIAIGADALDSAYALEGTYEVHEVEQVPTQMYYNGRLATIIEEENNVEETEEETEEENN